MKGLYIVIMFALLLSHISFAQQNTCDYKVEILVDGEEFEKEDFKWRMKATKVEGKSTNITGTAEIKANGKTVKSYKPWTSASISKQKTSNEYSPNLNPGEYEIKAEIKIECEDTDKDNNIDTKTVKIKGEKEEKTAKNSKEAGKKAVNNEVKNEEKPKIATNSENVIDTKSKKLTKNEEVDNVIQLSNKNSQKNHELLPTANLAQNSEIVYESSNEKAKSMIMIFLLTLSILLNIILIWRR